MVDLPSRRHWGRDRWAASTASSAVSSLAVMRSAVGGRFHFRHRHGVPKRETERNDGKHDEQLHGAVLVWGNCTHRDKKPWTRRLTLRANATTVATAGPR